MKVKLLISRADAHRAYGRGEIVEVSDAEAKRLVAAGKALLVDEAPSSPAPEKETATKKRRKSERRV